MSSSCRDQSNNLSSVTLKRILPPSRLNLTGISQGVVSIKVRLSKIDFFGHASSPLSSPCVFIPNVLNYSRVKQGWHRRVDEKRQKKNAKKHLIKMRPSSKKKEGGGVESTKSRTEGHEWLLIVTL